MSSQPDAKRANESQSPSDTARSDQTPLPVDVARFNSMRPPVDVARSPFARFRPLPFSAVRLQGGFWATRREVNRERSLPHGHAMLVESGVFRNFERVRDASRRAGGRSGTGAGSNAAGGASGSDPGPAVDPIAPLRLAAGRPTAAYEGKRYADSDLYKWLEAASYEIGNARSEGREISFDAVELERQVREAVRLIEETQDPTGYLYTYYQVLRSPEERWRRVDQDHELYCAGHLFQAAVAHLRCTGESGLAEAARRLADLMCEALGPGRNEGLPVHPGVEMALVEMYRAFGVERYLDLARHLVESRGRGRIGGRVYNQDHLPVREAREIAGHAVMQLYLLSGAADLYLESGDGELLAALEALWEDLVRTKMSISGGVGARHEMEAFGEAYELPNDRCYNETCAQIAAVMWAWRMLLATGDARYADYIEWSLYNGVLPGVSLDGRLFFYPNPLLSRGGVERSRWFECACCPPNVMRTLASLHTYFATTSDRELQIHLYDSGSLAASFADGARIELSIETRYPWEGEIAIRVESARAGEGPDVRGGAATAGAPRGAAAGIGAATADANLRAAAGGAGYPELAVSLRIPSWCRSASVAVNREPTGERAVPGSYLTIRRSWRPGDEIHLHLEMQPALYVAHPRVEAARGAVALARGPLLYCFEDHDQPEEVSLLDSVLRTGTSIGTRWEEGLLGGVLVLEATGGAVQRSVPGEPLYRRHRDGDAVPGEPVPAVPITAADDPGEELAARERKSSDLKLRAIPYFAWANRGSGAMQVWMPIHQ